MRRAIICARTRNAHRCANTKPRPPEAAAGCALAWTLVYVGGKGLNFALSLAFLVGPKDPRQRGRRGTGWRREGAKRHHRSPRRRPTRKPGNRTPGDRMSNGTWGVSDRGHGKAGYAPRDRIAGGGGATLSQGFFARAVPNLGCGGGGVRLIGIFARTLLVASILPINLLYQRALQHGRPSDLPVSPVIPADDRIDSSGLHDAQPALLSLCFFSPQRPFGARGSAASRRRCGRTGRPPKRSPFSSRGITARRPCP